MPRRLVICGVVLMVSADGGAAGSPGSLAVMTASAPPLAAKPRRDAAPWDAAEFSLILGGPLYLGLRRVGFYDEAAGRTARRVALAIAIAWLPLVVLTALDGALLGGPGAPPFLLDYSVQARLLAVTPLIVFSEHLVHLRLRPTIRQFPERGLVRTREMPRFRDDLHRAMRLRNSFVAEAALLALIGGLAVWRGHAHETLLAPWAWRTSPEGVRQVSPAGLWFVFVSLPLFQFLMLRWYFRLLIWALFLWRVSRLDLDLDASHPDRTGGLGFVGGSLTAFVPVAAAHGLLLAGLIADRIFYAGAKLTDFKFEVAGAVGVLLAIFLGPMLVFVLPLARVKRRGLLEYGALAQDYVRAFDLKWLRGGAPADEALIGSGDIQSLADLANSFAVVREMRIAPISRPAVLLFVGAILAPIAPLMLTIVPADELLTTLVKLVF